MYYILLFITLISMQWILCLYFIDVRIKKMIIKDSQSCESIKSSGKKKYCFLICLEMILFAGFRATYIGADTSVYLDALDYYKSLPLGDILQAPLVYPFDFEAGYCLLTKICACLQVSKTAFLLVVATLIYIPLFTFLNKNSKNPLLSVLAYIAFGFFSYSIGLFRQMIAMSICLCGVPFIKQKRLVKYCLCCVLACLFHSTALIMIPFYWISRLDLKRNRILYLVSVLLIEVFCIIFGRKIVDFFLYLVPKYSGYIGSKYDVQGGTYLNIIYLNVLLILGLFVVEPKEQEGSICVQAIMVAGILQSCSYALGVMGRIVCYYSVYSIILLPLIANHIIKEKNIAQIGLYVLLFAFTLYVVNNDSVLLNFRFL